MKKCLNILGFISVALLLPGCTSVVDYDAPVSAQERDLYIIREGESLYAIAWRYGLDYKLVAAWNNIKPPYTIYPGQRIRLNPPSAIARAETPQSRAESPMQPAPPPRPSAPVARTTNPVAAQPTLRPPPPVHSPPVTSSPSPSAVQAAAHRWQWPVQGEIIRRFEPYGNGKKGIDIAGQSGQPIQAASSGKVVYSGGGLVGYGQLIIIKHDQNFLSAYAHNRKLLVKEGEQVRAGQMIAELGSTGAPRPMLHFEIRLDGEPVDPLRYLPRR